MVIRAHDDPVLRGDGTREEWKAALDGVQDEKVALSEADLDLPRRANGGVETGAKERVDGLADEFRLGGDGERSIHDDHQVNVATRRWRAVDAGAEENDPLGMELLGDQGDGIGDRLTTRFDPRRGCGDTSGER